MEKQQADRLERKLDQLLRNSAKSTWVSGRTVASLTGWGSSKLRAMRDQGVLKFKRSGKQSIKYHLESIPEVFIKRTTA